MLKFNNAYICLIPDKLVYVHPNPFVKWAVQPDFEQWMKEHIPKHKFSQIMSSVMLEIEDVEADRALLKLTWNVH